MDRSEFLKIMGAAALTTAAATSCVGGAAKKSILTEEAQAAQGEFTVRTSSKGEKIGLLGYGCMRWPLLKNPPKGVSIVDQEAVDDLVDYALEHGVNYFDTAPRYIQGWSEPTMGISLSRHPREKYLIATKLSNQASPSREASLEMYHNSFERLKVDYIDYYLLHSVGNSIKNFNERFIDNGVLEYLLKEREEGRIRNLGWSFHGNVETFDAILALHEKYHWDFVQIQLNYSDWRHARGANVNAEYLYGELEKRDIKVIVMEPLLGGRLSNLPEYLMDRLIQREPDQSVASWAFRFAASHKNVLCVLSGMTYLEHLQDNLGTYSPLKPLSEEELIFLERTAEMIMEYPTVDCNDCDYCMPCPYGLDIPGIFTHYNKCITEGNFASSRGDENYKKARRAYLISYDRAIPSRRQADHCISCRKCVEHCPQSIDIPAQLTHINNYIEKLRQGIL